MKYELRKNAEEPDLQFSTQNKIFVGRCGANLTPDRTKIYNPHEIIRHIYIAFQDLYNVTPVT